MSFLGQRDFGLEVSLGNVPDYLGVFKFGQALDCDSGVPTDVWDGADGTTSTDLWVPPTTARLHDLVSSSASDDNAAGVGMRQVQVFGLTSWSTEEVSEVVDLISAYRAAETTA